MRDKEREQTEDDGGRSSPPVELEFVLTMFIFASLT